MTQENQAPKEPKCPSRLSLEEAKKLKEEFVQLVQSGRLKQFATKIISRFKKRGRLPGDITPENVVQELCVEFLRPVKGQGMEEKEELHRLRLYNPEKKTKFETYLYQCMGNLVKTMLDRTNRNPDPVSYHNMVDSGGNDDGNNPFLNIIAVENTDLPPGKIQEIVSAFEATLISNLDRFVFDKLVRGMGVGKDGRPIEFRPKEFCAKAEAEGKIRNAKRMYARILRSRAKLKESFVLFINRRDFFKDEVYLD